MSVQIKCRKCRNLIVDHSEAAPALVNPHGGLKELTTCQDINLVYLNEDRLPDWITNKIENSQWTKGRLHCSKCESRIGAFDFVSGTKCDCTSHTVPSVHIIKSKVDVIN